MYETEAILQAAELAQQDRDRQSGDHVRRIGALAHQAGVLAAGQAIVEIKRLLPGGWFAFFRPAQEPGDTATILRVVDGRGEVFYYLKDEGGLVDELVPAQDYLTRALEGEVQFQRNDMGELILQLQRL